MSELPGQEDPDNVSEVIAKYVRDLYANSGHMMTGLVCLTTYINPEGSRCFAFSIGEGQGPEVTAGLSDVIQQFAMDILRGSFSVDLTE